ncbi:hypothetical protein AOQ73_30535 [Bradyrhizobium pachyrhizi]|nr:hypothetical protein AOQ73_30535 [Bradyrhizobium pachyrhizi]
MSRGWDRSAITNVVLAKARTNNHRLVLLEGSGPSIARQFAFGIMGPGLRQDDEDGPRFMMMPGRMRAHGCFPGVVSA